VNRRHQMHVTAKHFRIAAVCVCLFLATQLFQGLCLLVLLPSPESLAEALALRGQALDQWRAFLVMAGLVLLMVPYAVIALDRIAAAPLASTLGFVFGALFVSIELVYRGVTLFEISRGLAPALLAAATPGERESILAAYAEWDELIGALYFPLLLAGFIASCCFAVATWRGEGRWHRLASLAFALNALRLLTRLLDDYAGATWLAPFNSLPAYLAGVVAVNAMLAAWLFGKARDEDAGRA
jgi:hypothetical protein